MASYNKVILMGNLTRDPVLRYLPSNTAVVEISLAVNHKYRTAQGEDREEVCFIECSAFGKQAETINQYCQKGRSLLVEGRLKLDTWEDKQGGGKRSKHRVNIESFTFVGGRNDAPGGGGGEGGGGHNAEGGEGGGGGASRPPQRAPMNRGPQQPQQPRGGGGAPPPEQPFSEEEQFTEDDLPF